MNPSFWLVLTVALVTAILRFLPFLAFQNRTLPPVILYLGNVLPYAIMGMLVVYCLKSTSFISCPYGIPELCAAALTVVLHKWKHNTLLSIIGGTACYVLLIQLVF